MSIRKSLAAGLIVAANALAKDRSKEKAQKWVRDARVASSPGLSSLKVDPLKRVPGCNPLGFHCPQQRWALHTRRLP
jgi:hypothetical protein